MFNEQIGTQTGADSLLRVLTTGLRYDISTAGIWTLTTFLLSIAVTAIPVGQFISRLRRLIASVYAVVSILLFGADLIFFNVYGDQFNQMIFGIAYDDTTAILITIWKEYHPLLFLGIAIPLIVVNRWLLLRWLNTSLRLPALASRLPQAGYPARLLSGVALFLLMATLVRGGSLTGVPIELKHAFVVKDMFLNRTVINPLSALRYAFKAKMQLESGSALERFWPDENIREAMRFELEQRGTSTGDSNNLDKLLSVTAGGHNGKKPKHIFLLLMESHSGWTVMPAYRNYGFSPEFSALASEGIYFPNFLPAGSGTIGSLSAIVTGMPDTEININYEPSSQSPYPSALAANLKRLGYTTRFFYGGYISWQRLDTFTKNQGFDELYGGGAMSAGIHTNEWGVDDSYLFNFVLETVKENDDKPSFNFILSTSNHPPYDLDLAALGYPQNDKPLPSPLVATKENTVRVLGHLWYADRQAGRFVRKASKQLDRALFAITGDHTARLNIKFPGDNVVEQTAVPFILYGPQVLPESGITKMTAGSHMDIPSTLIELAADPGYRYTAYGHSMLAKGSPSYGFGHNYIIGENYIVNDNKDYRIFSLSQGKAPQALPGMSDEVTRYSALKALTWYRVKKGAELPQATTHSNIAKN